MLDGKSNVKGVSKGSTIFGVGGKNHWHLFYA